MSAAPVAIILGVGPGIGLSVAKKWAKKGFKVACVCRDLAKAEGIAALSGPSAKGYSADVTSEEQMKSMVAKVKTDLGKNIETLVYNAGKGVFKKYDEMTIKEFEASLACNTTGLLIATQLICPGMVARGKGVVAVTGATASLRGKPFTAGFAPAKGAQRLLLQSIARQLNPSGVHCFLAIIDGSVGPEGGEVNPDGNYTKMDPSEIADVYWDVSQQARSVWTQEIDLRPNMENW